MWSNAKREKKFRFQNQVNEGWVKSVDEERDLRVIMSKDLKFSKQYILARNKANLMLGIMNREVSYKSAEVLSPVIISEEWVFFCTRIQKIDSLICWGVSRDLWPMRCHIAAEHEI